MVRQSRNASSHQNRRWLFRIGAIMLGCSVFVVAEVFCIALGWGRPVDQDDPYVGFSNVYPLFVRDKIGENYEIAKSRRKFFAAESFPIRKGPNTFRAFCLGGSTVQGRPYSTPTSFTTWLQLSLTAADENRGWQVVNCGGISYASYRLVPILQECLAYQPDLFIICTGHNEFLEERTYDHIKHAPQLWSAIQQNVSRLRLYTLFRNALPKSSEPSSARAQPNRPTMKAEVDALLDYNGGLKPYHRDEKFRAGVIEHYEHNLRRLIRLARNADVPVLLIRPPSNLCDCPPFKSQHRDDLTAAERKKWESLFRQARDHFRHDVQSSVRLLRQALEIDDQFALAFSELGKCFEAIGLRQQARDAYWQARELDICPLRMLEPMEQALAEVARETNTPLIDAHELLERDCPSGMLGNHLLEDHIHPNFRGHQMIANALTDEMVRQGWCRPAAGWKQKREAAYRRHFNSLDDLYFASGQRTIRSLRAWTQGRADGPKIETRMKHKSPQPAR